MAEHQKGSSLWLIAGGIIAAILLVFWLMSGDDSETPGAGGDTAVSVESAEPSSDSAVEVEPAEPEGN